MSAEQALQYGLIDHIVEPDASKWANLSAPPPNLAPLVNSEEVGDYDFSKIVRSMRLRITTTLNLFLECSWAAQSRRAYSLRSGLSIH